MTLPLRYANYDDLPEGWEDDEVLEIHLDGLYDGLEDLTAIAALYQDQADRLIALYNDGWRIAGISDGKLFLEK